MASPKVTAGDSDSDQTFPEANVSEELNLGVPENFPVDPVSSDVAAVKEADEPEELKVTARAKAKAEAEAEKCTVVQTIMSTLLVSGVVLAVIGVGFVVTKKLRET